MAFLMAEYLIIEAAHGIKGAKLRSTRRVMGLEVSS
jgi:hypothetical protein